MNDKKLYPLFIVMVGVTTLATIFTAYHSHLERKANAEERKLRIEDLKRKGNGKQK